MNNDEQLSAAWSRASYLQAERDDLRNQLRAKEKERADTDSSYRDLRERHLKIMAGYEHLPRASARMFRLSLSVSEIVFQNAAMPIDSVFEATIKDILIRVEGALRGSVCNTIRAERSEILLRPEAAEMFIQTTTPTPTPASDGSVPHAR